MTDPVPATATGLPSATATAAFDRRSFLATLAAAGVMTPECVEGATSLPLVADYPDAELLALLDLIVEAAARRSDFGTRSDAAYAEHYRAPPYTEAMLWRPADRF